MLFRLPIAYWSKVIKPRCRVEERVLCGEWIEVEVQEATDLEAPVAMRWREHDYGDGPGEIKETRWFDEGHYMPYEHREQPLDAHLLADLCAKGSAYQNPLIVSTDWFIRDMFKYNALPLAEMKVRAIISSDREETIAKTLECAKGLVLVDGVLWDNVGEPVYEYRDRLGIEVKHFTRGKGQEPSADDIVKSRSRFRADRYDDIVEHVHAEDDERQIRIDVLVPESVRYDDETPAFIEAARATVDSNQSSLSGLPKHALMAWVDLRDAHLLASEDTSPEVLTSLEEAMRVYERIFEDSWCANTARAALQRWDLRPMTANFDTSNSPSP
jgi:hypothetical protein